MSYKIRRCPICGHETHIHEKNVGRQVQFFVKNHCEHTDRVESEGVALLSEFDVNNFFHKVWVFG